MPSPESQSNARLQTANYDNLRKCRTCSGRRVKCSKTRPVCTSCEKIGRPCVWFDDDPESQTLGDSVVGSGEESSNLKNIAESAIERLQNHNATQDKEKGGLPFGNDADSSPLSSINVSLLEEAEGRAIDSPLTHKEFQPEKRKVGEDGTNEAGADFKRARQDSAVTLTINDVDEGIVHNQAATVNASTVRETTLTPTSSDDNEYTKIIATETNTQEVRLTSAAANPSIELPTTPAFVEPKALTLSPQHITLARIPGSTPLDATTIDTAASWFAKLLADGNGIDMLQIHRTLGVRIYQEEDLETYQRLRSEIALEKARKDALALEGAVKKDNVREHEDGAGSQTQGLRSRSMVQEPRYGNTARPSSLNDNRPYTLRPRHKGGTGFHGNGHYSAYGQPKTQEAQRKLEMKDAAGAEDVVRVYE
jgi:hypothetical protein